MIDCNPWFNWSNNIFSPFVCPNNCILCLWFLECFFPLFKESDISENSLCMPCNFFLFLVFLRIKGIYYGFKKGGSFLEKGRSDSIPQTVEKQNFCTSSFSRDPSWGLCQGFRLKGNRIFEYLLLTSFVEILFLIIEHHYWCI